MSADGRSRAVIRADAFDEVSITVEQAPTISAAGDDQTICAITATLAGNTPAIGTGIWTIVSGSGTFADASSPTTSVSNLAVGVNTFAWTISNGTCTSSTDQVSINVDQNPVTPNAGTDQTICATSSTLNATAVSGGSWTVISGSGIIANPALANSAVSNLSNGLNTFRWTISGGSCPDAFDEVSITVDPNPTTAFAGNDQTICATTADLAGSTPTIGTGTWTLISGSEPLQMQVRQQLQFPILEPAQMFSPGLFLMEVARLQLIRLPSTLNKIRLPRMPESIKASVQPVQR